MLLDCTRNRLGSGIDVKAVTKAELDAKTKNP
jgi:hypothetical protein